MSLCSKLRDGVDQLQQTIKSSRTQRSGSVTSAAKLPPPLHRHPPASCVGSEEVDDDWTPRAQNFEQQQPLLQQQQIQLLRLQQEELDFESGAVEDRRSNLSQISKDAAQVSCCAYAARRSRPLSGGRVMIWLSQVQELFREVAQCVQQGGERIDMIDQMVDDAHAGAATHLCPVPHFRALKCSPETLQGARDIHKASKKTSSNIGIGAIVGGAIGAGVGTLLGPAGVAAIGSASAVVGGAIAKGMNVLKEKMIAREARKAGINLDGD
jgi:hypothetical protein